ncbi:MAG: TspO/MBR family protein [Pseudomonadota bacterium]
MSLTTLAVFVVINLVVASSGAMFKPGPWYEGLEKPGWTPPNWAFPVVWSILFFMNAAAGAIVWDAEPAGRGLIFTIYGLSLLLNAGWSALFFGMKRMDLALIEVAGLWLSIAVVAALFAPVSLLAAALLLPYLAWVGVAALLNQQVLQRNAGAARAR